METSIFCSFAERRDGRNRSKLGIRLHGDKGGVGASVSANWVLVFRRPGQCFDETHHPGRVRQFEITQWWPNLYRLQEIGDVWKNKKEFKKDPRFLTCGLARRSHVPSWRITHCSFRAKYIPPVELPVDRAGWSVEGSRLVYLFVLTCLLYFLIACVHYYSFVVMILLILFIIVHMYIRTYYQ